MTPPGGPQGSTVLVLKDNRMGILIRRSAAFPSDSLAFSFGASACLIASLSYSTSLPPTLSVAKQMPTKESGNIAVWEKVTRLRERLTVQGLLVLTSYQRCLY